MRRDFESMKHSISGSGSDSVTVMRRIHHSVRFCVAATESGLSGMLAARARHSAWELRPSLITIHTYTNQGTSVSHVIIIRLISGFSTDSSSFKNHFLVRCQCILHSASMPLSCVHPACTPPKPLQQLNVRTTLCFPLDPAMAFNSVLIATSS
jgi:hypothetical protein